MGPIPQYLVSGSWKHSEPLTFLLPQTAWPMVLAGSTGG